MIVMVSIAAIVDDFEGKGVNHCRLEGLYKEWMRRIGASSSSLALDGPLRAEAHVVISDEKATIRESFVDRERQIEALASDVGPMAYGIALKMLGDRQNAEDALQDAYLQAYRGLTSFRGQASLKTWFLRILVNSCRRHRRIWRRWTATISEASSEEQDQSQDQAETDPGLRKELRHAILQLPHRQRTALVLRYGQELTIDEIAEIMECAPGTVKATLHKAVAKLRQSLGEKLDNERGKS